MRLTIAGPGRAGGAIALAASRAGHQIAGVLSRSGETGYGPSLPWDRPLPATDVLIIAVRDDSIEQVSARVAPMARTVRVAAHLSGFTPVTVLHDLAEAGVETGGMHPLQTLPDPERGADALAGSFAGIGGSSVAVESLTDLAESMGMMPFPLSDESRPLYHAGAAAASNFVITALATAGDLMQEARIDPVVTRPLVERAVENLYQAGGSASLTGPIARGDVSTVTGQLSAADDVSEEVGEQYRLMAQATAVRAGRREDVSRWK